MYPPKRRRLPLAGLGLIGAGGALGVALSMPGTAYADPSQESSTSSGPQQGSSEPTRKSTGGGSAAAAVSPPDERRVAPGVTSATRAPTSGVAMVSARLEVAVAEGRLTRDQADTILAAAEVGLLNGDLVGGPGGRRGPSIDRQGR